MNIHKIKKLISILKSKLFLKALFKGVAAGAEHLPVLNDIKCDFVVDVGANRGQFALIARKLYPKACIHSFEPLVEPANIFSSVFQEDSNIHLHRFAIGPENKEMIVHISERDDSSSLLPISHTQSEMFPHTGEVDTRKTSVFRLDEALLVSEITSNSLLKIDVQGYELEVLKGCSNHLNKFKYVYVECSFVELYEGQAFASEVIIYLHNKQFDLIGVYNICYDNNGKAIQADFLFKKSN